MNKNTNPECSVVGLLLVRVKLVNFRFYDRKSLFLCASDVCIFGFNNEWQCSHLGGMCQTFFLLICWRATVG